MDSGGGLGSTEIDEDLRVHPPLSAAELQSFAARMELTTDELRQIVAPMEGFACIDLRKELEDWVKDHAEEKKRTDGMNLQQLNADMVARFIPEYKAEISHAEGLVAAFKREKEEEAAKVFDILIMVFSKVEVNLRRLLESAPRQQNQAKLVHYITTARELLEQLGAEITPEGTSSVSKAKLGEYSEKIEALAATLAAPVQEDENPVDESREEESSYEREKVRSPISLSSGLRRRSTAQVEVGPSSHERKERDTGAPIKLDAEAQAHIEKHRKLQEDLTDEMVDLARQLKESSMLMNQSVKDTEKILDSTERAVEHSLASTGRATARASEVYSLASKTTCFQWLLIFMMTCMFVMVVLLIRVT